MPSKSWKDVNKFRLVCYAMMAILTGFMFSLQDDTLQIVEIVRTFIQTGITVVAYLQCPTIPLKINTTNTQ